MGVIHAIVFRLIGEVFGMLPTVSEVTISGYFQRKSKLNGHEENQHLLSVVVRQQCQEINFESLDAIDPVEALNRFKLRRDMTKTGILKAIEPYIDFEMMQQAEVDHRRGSMSELCDDLLENEAPLVYGEHKPSFDEA